ncbi:unnamed protein product [Colias eurytheme]|nr:unnamed protein product [Colias eurytheme]
MPRRRHVQAAAAYIILSNKKRRKNNTERKCWVKPWLEKRMAQGAFENLLKELTMEDQHGFFNFIRMNTTSFEFLLEKVAPKIKKKDTHFRQAISPAEKLMVTLRFLATGDSYQSLMYLFRISASTISLFIPEVCLAIYTALKQYIKVPTTTEEWLKIAEGYEIIWQFPHCIGAIDGKHIIIKAPGHSGSTYFNYKGSHSVVLMIVVDANYRIIYMNCGNIGRISDGGVFHNTALYAALESGNLSLPPPRPLQGRQVDVPYVLVADDAFALSKYLMKPYPYSNQPIDKRVYNYCLSRARRMVESVFSIMASRFRILRKPIELCPEKVQSVVSTIAALHNFLTSSSNSQGYLSRDDIEVLPTDSMVGLNTNNNNNPTVAAINHVE